MLNNYYCSALLCTTVLKICESGLQYVKLLVFEVRETCVKQPSGSPSCDSHYTVWRAGRRRSRGAPRPGGSRPRTPLPRSGAGSVRPEPTARCSRRTPTLTAAGTGWPAAPAALRAPPADDAPAREPEDQTDVLP